jgi:SAM-dependent methyltransferase
MAVAVLKSLLDKRQLALTRAKLRAWWEGETFDEAAAIAAIEASLANDRTLGGADDALFDEPPLELPPRLQALALLWGDGRVRPGDTAIDKFDPAGIGLAPDGVLALLGPGLMGPLASVAAAHPGKIDVFEWREETFEALQYGIRKARLEDRVTLARIDLESHHFHHDVYDALLSIDDFAYCSYPPHLAQQILKCLKVGGSALIESYVGFRAAELATAFATSFAEPQIRPHGDMLQFFTDAGLTLQADDDLTEEVLATARAVFKDLGARLADAGELEPATARELGWEAEAWRMRLKLLAQRRLERRRFVVKKMFDPLQPANANAPAG